MASEAQPITLTGFDISSLSRLPGKLPGQSDLD